MRKSVIAGLAIALIGTLTWVPQSNAATYGSVSHIHDVKVFGDRVLLNTHEGLYEYLAANFIKKLSRDDFDVMGLATYGPTLYSSGHPGAKSDLPNPVGLLSSADGGKTWKKVSLQGEVDFHMLEVGKSDIYGADSGSGQLMYSSNLGKSWRKLGENKYSDIAVLGTKSGSALALESGKLLQTTNAFKTSTSVKSSMKWSSLEIVGTTLYASSAKAIYRSVNSGKSWKKMATLSSEISSISANAKVFVAVTSEAIFVSRDGGKSFKS
ncbi:MAG: hypothetical protein HW379_1486 [Actinobacteria bacterium]|jgi:hypothetical protein|nr:hypothetical protein [Actinomycetota bacterium]